MKKRQLRWVAISGIMVGLLVGGGYIPYPYLGLMPTPVHRVVAGIANVTFWITGCMAIGATRPRGVHE